MQIILLGDSAVGKSKLVERFLLDGYAPQQLSTYALTLYRYRTRAGARDVLVDFWDTAGQERFNTMHRSYYHQAHAAVLVFDSTRKVRHTTDVSQCLPIYCETLHCETSLACSMSSITFMSAAGDLQEPGHLARGAAPAPPPHPRPSRSQQD